MSTHSEVPSETHAAGQHSDVASSVLTIWYVAVHSMTKTKTTKTTVATPDLDPATLAQLDVLKRQRERANRVLLKRRRQKSGQ